MESKKRSERNHETWLADYEGNTYKSYLRVWDLWVKFLEPHDEKWLLENKMSEDWASHLTAFHKWLGTQPKGRGKGLLSDNSRKIYTNAIRGYLRHVGISTGLSRGQRLQISKVESMPMKDYPFDLRTKMKLLMVADPIEEYIISAGVSFGLRIGDFLLITRGQLEPLLDKEIPIAIGKITTQKEGINAFPYIDADAKYAIKRLLEQLDREGRTAPSEHMLQIDARRLNTLLRRLFKKAGIPLGEYRIRFHVLRKFISDSLASVCSGDKWKYFVGKKADSPYVKAEGREAYKRVLQLTQVNGSQSLRAPNQEVEELRQKLEEALRENQLQKKIIQGLVLDKTGKISGTKTFPRPPHASSEDTFLSLIPNATEMDMDEIREYLFGKSKKKRERES